MAVAEHKLAVAVEEVEGAEWPHLGGEGGDGFEPETERRGAAMPERRQSLQQEAEGAFRIGLAHGVEAMRRVGGAGHDLGEIAIVREEMRAAAQLTHEGLGVGQAVAALRGAADVRDQQVRRQRVLLDEGEPWAVVRGLGLLVETDLVAFMKRDAPAVDVSRGRRAVGREAAQREARAGRLAAGQAEEFAHGRGR